jgi:hypothetical protein
VRALLNNILIDPPILRLLWSIVSTIQYQDLMVLPDAELSQRIVSEINHQLVLDTDQCDSIGSYIHSKMMLIRDLAESA